MEETLQQENQESEYKDPNEGQDGIRRRLRDRNLLRKRKAEAEEKETNQVESQRKRPRADSGIKRRGRPRKSEPAPEISAIQEETAEPEEEPDYVVIEPQDVFPDLTPVSQASLLPVESQSSSFLAAPAPAPELGSDQSFVFAPTPLNPTPSLLSPSDPAPPPLKVLDRVPIPVQEPAPAPDDVPVPVPVPVLMPAPVQAAAPAPPADPPQVETFFTESQDDREAQDQVVIEDLGPDEKQDFPSSQDKRADEDLFEIPSISVPEQNEMFSDPTFSSAPPPQKYFPGNSF
ncbi:uncharacterized protein hemgn isoform X2 [Centropristis striata]|uniref:uncharacterized protein hemgn isoform X2 n=1 Tax=Centropristis striata TaxID=184440 RepID=UPI0027E1C40D|nr:uncharacterized protein hemgn isoform X2 [Centropristis striata]